MIATSFTALRKIGLGMLIALVAASAPAFAQDAPANTSPNPATAQQQNPPPQDGWKHFSGGWSNQSATTPRATVAPAPSTSTAKQVAPNTEQNTDPNAEVAPQDNSQNPPPNVPAVIPTNPQANAPAKGLPNAAPEATSAWKLTIPQGAYVTVRINEALSSDRNQEGDAFSATLVQPVITNGVVVAQRGQTVGGRVAEAKKAGRVSGVSRLRLELTGLTLVDGQHVPIQSQLMSLNGPTSVGRDVAAVAGTTALGAAVGAGAAWSTGAALGAGAGFGAGIIGVLLTRGRPTVLYPETQLTFQLTAPVTVDTEHAPQAFRVADEADYPPYQATASYQAPGAACGPYGCPAPYAYAYPYPYPYPYYAYYGPYYPYYWGPGFGFYFGRGYYGRFRGAYRR